MGEYKSVVQAIRVLRRNVTEQAGTLEAVSDPRKGGRASGY
jgi:gamma-glutamyltranspeptidase